jgi:PAS domain S-box-containing protein
MTWQTLPYLLPLFGAIVLLAGLAIYSWRRTAVSGTRPFTVLMLAVFIWTVGYTLELVSADPAFRVLWAKVEYLGIVTIPVAWLAFALKYTGQERWVSRRNVVLLSILPLVTLLLVWTNELHQLVWRQIRQEPVGPFRVLDLSYGPMFWLNVVYTYLLLWLGTVLLARMLVRMSRIYRRQAVVSLIGVLTPWVGNVLYVAGVTQLDFTPITFAIAGPVMIWGLFRYHLLDLVPVAQKAIIEGSPNGMVVLDARDRIVDLNPAAEEILGCDASELVGQLFDTEAWGFQVMNVDRREGHSEIHIPHNQSTYELRSSPLRDQRGRLTGRVVTMHDITRQKQTEADLLRAMVDAEEARIMAESANRAKSVFLANMSHELRTPLNAVLGFSQLMRDAPNLTPEQRSNLKIIQHSGRHLLALINDVLDMSKIEAGEMTLEPEGFDLHEMLFVLEETFSRRAEQKGLTVALDLAPDLPRAVRADPGKLRQVLTNLLDNAIKFVEEGGITIRAWRGKPSEAGPPEADRETAASTLVHFEVEDTGVGVAPDELDALFEAFEQTESGRRSQQGTGLGLPISRRYVEMMGGELTVTSQVGLGSCFSFEIPVETIDAAVAQEDRAKRPVGLAPGAPRYRLLAVDDVEAGRQLLVKLLQPLGFDVRTADNGQEALERWQAWEPDLIFMNMQMPVLDGREATRRIRALPGGEKTVIIALTASAFQEERATIIGYGFDDFVRKPFLETTILEILEKHLGVEFVYEASKAAGEAPAEAPASETTAAAVDMIWLAEMRQATIEGDPQWMERLISQIEGRHPQIASQLNELAYDFAHDEILQLLDELTLR